MTMGDESSNITRQPLAQFSNGYTRATLTAACSWYNRFQIDIWKVATGVLQVVLAFPQDMDGKLVLLSNQTSGNPIQQVIVSIGIGGHVNFNHQIRR